MALGEGEMAEVSGRWREGEKGRARPNESVSVRNDETALSRRSLAEELNLHFGTACHRPYHPCHLRRLASR